MNVKGTDEIIKLLLEINAGKGRVENSNLEKVPLKNEEITLRKDEFILDDKVNNAKTEVQFIRNTNETPEEYLHRISMDIVRQRENVKINLIDEMHNSGSKSNEIVETVTRTGLLSKKYGDRIVVESEYSEVNNQKKWLNRVVIVFLLVLIISVLIIK